MIQVKCFEEDHEEDLEDQLNQFLSELDDDQLTDIKFSVSHFEQSEQIYSFCALVIYRIKSENKGRIGYRR